MGRKRCRHWDSLAGEAGAAGAGCRTVGIRLGITVRAGCFVNPKACVWVPGLWAMVVAAQLR